jgi:ADP-L-glycero-D-manno-heptose 6-epimerase
MSSYYVVTGAAGFIGTNIVRALNARGVTDIIAVDNLERAEKFSNLVGCQLADYFDKHDFRADVREGRFDGAIEAVIHQGACSDTMEHDGRYMLDNNFRYSVELLDFCQDEEIPFLYASSAAVYGAGRVFREEPEHEAALNVYGYSKQLFDQIVRRRLPDVTAPVVGFRYFNVYGPWEAHKGRMASVAWHFFNEYRATGQVKLFTGSGGYANGEQRRDFVSVEDAAQVCMWFLDHQRRSGIFNVGTGRAQTFNEVAVATVNACRQAAHEPPATLDALVRAGTIGYIPFPEALAGKYQHYTCADLAALRAAGYDASFYDVETGVGRYVEHLLATLKT